MEHQEVQSLWDEDVNSLFQRFSEIVSKTGFNIKRGNRGIKGKQRIYWLCQYGPSTTKAKQSRLTDCPFQITVEHTTTGGYKGTISRSIHNHFIAGQPSTNQVPATHTSQYFNQRARRQKAQRYKSVPLHMVSTLTPDSLTDIWLGHAYQSSTNISPPDTQLVSDIWTSDTSTPVTEPTFLVSEADLPDLAVDGLTESDTLREEAHALFLEQCDQNMCPRPHCRYDMGPEEGHIWRAKANGNDFSCIDPTIQRQLCEEHKLAVKTRSWQANGLPLDSNGQPWLDEALAISKCQKSYSMVLKDIHSRRQKDMLWLQEFALVLAGKSTTGRDIPCHRVCELGYSSGLQNKPASHYPPPPSLGYYGLAFGTKLSSLFEGFALPSLDKIPTLESIREECDLSNRDLQQLFGQYVLHPELVTSLVMDDFGLSDRRDAYKKMKDTEHLSDVIGSLVHCV